MKIRSQTRARPLLLDALAWTLALMTLAGTPLAAHDVWLEPSDYRPSGSQVAVRVLVGENFIGDGVPRDSARMLRFAAIGPDGEQPLEGIDGVDPAGFFRPAAPGAHELLYVSEPRPIRLSASKFEAYLAEEGLDHVARARRESDSGSEPVTELYSRCAKAIVVVGTDAGGAGAPRGCPLELVVVAGLEPAAGSGPRRVTFELLRAGRPLEGGLVRALVSGSPAGALEARSDSAGRVTFTLDTGGPWLVKAVHMEPAKAALEADWESWWASLTFALPDG